jgi:hypothetical protein
VIEAVQIEEKRRFYITWAIEPIYRGDVCLEFIVMKNSIPQEKGLDPFERVRSTFYALLSKIIEIKW